MDIDSNLDKIIKDEFDFSGTSRDKSFKSEGKNYQTGKLPKWKRDNHLKNSSNSHNKYTVQISNLHYEIGSEELKKIFQKYDPTNIQIQYDKSDRSEGIASFIVDNVEFANDIKENFDGKPINEQIVSISYKKKPGFESLASRLNPRKSEYNVNALKKPYPSSSSSSWRGNYRMNRSGNRVKKYNRRRSSRTQTKEELDKALDEYWNGNKSDVTSSNNTSDNNNKADYDKYNNVIRSKFMVSDENKNSGLSRELGKGLEIYNTDGVEVNVPLGAYKTHYYAVSDMMTDEDY